MKTFKLFGRYIKKSCADCAADLPANQASGLLPRLLASWLLSTLPRATRLFRVAPQDDERDSGCGCAAHQANRGQLFA